MAYYATRTKGGKLVNRICGLRCDSERAVRTLTSCKCICLGSRACSESRLGSIFPVNNSSKNSVGTEIPMKSVVHIKRTKKTGSIVNYSCLLYTSPSPRD